jgi:S-adenosylmethionine:tRNA ribosyltransferase-isomerase
MKTNDFYYELPQELIAQSPAVQRHMSRLLLLDRNSGVTGHKMFYEIKDFFKKGDCIVLNDTRVIPASLTGYDVHSGGKAEFLLVKEIGRDIWDVLVKPGRKVKPGNIYMMADGLLQASIITRNDEGGRLVSFKYDGDFKEILDKAGILPLPPYIKKKPTDYMRYQTVYARKDGSIAAPTAGLHFTDELLEEIQLKGIETAYITLHVGIGTFRPVKSENVEEHRMHEEYYSIAGDTCDKINKTVQAGGRIIAVGTTTCRVLEAVSKENGLANPGNGWTDIFIYPGHRFKIVNALVTNFHLPCSTLIMLVSAFAGRENILNAYEEAIRLKYRFYSFGDAMFIS